MLFPKLYIGRALFNKASAHDFLLVDASRPDLIEFLQDLSLTDGVGVLITDIAAKPYLINTFLLKFVEDYKEKVALFSSVDCFNSVFLSRCRSVEKSIEIEKDEDLSVVMRNFFLYKIYVGKYKMKRRILNIWIGVNE